MKKSKISALSALVCICAMAPNAFADDTVSVDVDNTAVNVRDANDTTRTPLDQSKGSRADVEATRKIRRLVMRDKSLSTNAHNVKIITLRGVTTLRGPVNSLEESTKIENLAKKVAGVSAVQNQLEVKQNN